MADPAAEDPEDVHLRVRLGGTVVDYRANAVAAWHFIHDWSEKRCEPIEVIDEASDALEGLPRLPCESLFIGP
ncbi:hypothetical protein [Nocardia sp. NPDC051570]|uniref:hypothetical protein n=1 Tax=Nocardia sp. NPDC051570 TaxID=3364324 RepID=UPI0037B1FBAB